MVARRNGNLRPYWKGDLRIDRVAFRVVAFDALVPRSDEIHLHPLHKGCYARVRTEWVCPTHGVISGDQVVRGYEYGKNKFVEVEPGELESLKTGAPPSLTLDTFLAPADFDPIYYAGRNFYLAPLGVHARKPYAVLHAALVRLNRYGVGQVVFEDRDQLALVRPARQALVMALLHAESELRPPETLGIAVQRGLDEEVRLAEQLVTAATEPFDFEGYDGIYHRRLSQMIEAKILGESSPWATPEQSPPVGSLRDALTRSLDDVRGPRATGEPPLPPRGVELRPVASPKKAQGKRAT